MQIIVFGASGTTGLEILKQALAAGHSVKAFVRSPSRVTIQHVNLIVNQGDATDQAAVAQAIIGQKAVISALGQTRPPVPGMLVKAYQNILDGMRKAGVRRIVATTGAGVRAPQDQPGIIDQVMKGLLNIVAAEVLRDSEAGAAAIRESELDWTVVRFPRLTGGVHTGAYRVGFLGRNSGIQISRADGADFVLKELVAGKYIRQMPVVSY
jgi:putative NADH-flavin reductase